MTSTYNLLTGIIWNPDTNKISNLKDYTSLPKTSLISVQSNKITSEIKDPITLLEAKETIVELKKPNISLESSVPTTKLQAANNKQTLAWKPLVKEIQTCEKCKLCNGRTHTVIERGNRNAKVMFIGEAPGEQEDIQGVPFVGASGQLLDKMIGAMKLDIYNDIYIANVVKCRPPKNRNPEPDEIAACNNYLINQIELINPQIIITLGRFAAQTVLKTDVAVGKLRGKIHKYENIPVIVTYHPSYLLRTPTAKKDSWEDLQLAMKYLDII